MQINYSFRRHRDGPKLTVRKGGSILIHQATVDEFGLMGTQFVSLHFNPIDSTLIINPSVDNFKASWKVYKQASGSLLIMGRPFLIKNKLLSAKASMILPVEWNLARGGIVVKIDQQK